MKLLTQVEQDSLALANVHLRKYPEVFGGGGLYGRGGYTLEKINLYRPESWIRLFKTRSRLAIGFFEFVDCGIDA